MPDAWLAERSTAELVELLASVLGILAARGEPEFPAEALECAERLGTSLDLGEAALATLVRCADRAGEPSRQCYPGTKGWLKIALGMRPGRAEERLTVARHLPRLPKVGANLAAGTLSYGYAATIASAVARLSDEDCEKAEPILLNLAESGATAHQVYRAGAHIKRLITDRDTPASEGPDTAAPDGDTPDTADTKLTPSHTCGSGPWPVSSVRVCSGNAQAGSAVTL